MSQPPLDVDKLIERLDAYLEVEFTFIRTEDLSAELAQMSRLRQDFILQWTKSAAAINTELGFQFARRAGEALNHADQEMVSAWCLYAMDCYDRTGLHAAMSVIRDLDGFLEQGYQRDAGSLFEDATPVLLPFVHGLEGRRMKVELADYAWTDGETLFLPEIIAKLDNEEDNFQLFKCVVSHLWAQMRFGTLNVNLTQALANYPDPEQALALFHLLETFRLNARIASELPGLYRRMQEIQSMLGGHPCPHDQHVLQRAKTALEQPEATVQDSLYWVDQHIDCDLPDAHCYQGRLNPEAAWAAREARIEKDKARFRETLRVIMDEINEGEEQAEQAAPLEAFDLKEKADAQESELLQQEIVLNDKPLPVPEDVKQQMSSILLDLSEIPLEYLTPAGPGEYDPALFEDETLNPDDVWAGAYHEEGAFFYNEWDAARQAHKKKWCVLRELEVEPIETDFYRQTLSKYSGHLHSLRKTFEILRGEDRLLRRQSDGDDLDIDALVEAMADLKVGHEMSENVFTRMHKDDRNIAVIFMVDMSGSTRGWINDAEREALILMAEALETLGDRYAIYGFSGWTRKRCEVFHIKGFDEPWSEQVIGKVCAIEPKDYTRMGAPIRHLTEKLKEVEARTKLLITLSDGKPDDYDLEYRGDYGIEDTRQALYEAHREGVHAYCITIDKEGQDYLPHMYGAANYTVLDQVSQLPLKISDIYRKITT